jgi:hypothetical protein
MSLIRALGALGLLLACAGVTFGQTVTSTYDKDYGLARLGSYQFRDVARGESDPLAADALMERKVRDALDEELRNMGYDPPPDGADPDFLVSFRARARDRTDGRGPGPAYVQGSLTLDFRDAKTGRLVWRGIASGVIGADEVDLKLAEEQAKRAARLLLEQFGKDLLGF